MPFRLLLLLILALLPFHRLLATECSAVFTSSQSFNVNGSSTINNSNQCNSSSCISPPTFTPVALPAISPSGAFNSTSVSNGSFEYTSWGLPKESTITYTGSSNGTAVLYFSGNVSIDKTTLINAGGDPANVMLVVYGNLTIDKDSQINAHVYVAGSASLQKDITFNGALAVAGSLSVDKDGSYNFDPSDVTEIVAPGFCDVTASTVHHYEIIHDGSGSTCAAETVTVKACLDAACASLSTDTISLDFQANSVTKSSPSFTGSTTFTFTHTTAETLTLSVANPSATPNNVLVCDSGGGNSCDISFTTTGCVNTCSSYFPGAVQGNDGGSSLTFKDTGQVLQDAGNIFAFPSLNDETSGSHNTCGSTDCSVSNTTVSAFTLSSFETTSSSTKIDLSGGSSTIGPGGDYAVTELEEVKLSSNANATFLATASDYKITKGLFNDNSVITFNAGTYWFDLLEIKNSTQVIINGPVVIYVNQAFKIEDDSQVNVGGVAKNLVFIGYQQINLKGDVQAKAVLYGASQDVLLEDNARLNGVISANGTLEIKGTSAVTYEDIAGLTIEGLCEDAAADIHHYQIIHENEGLTCAEEEITINACEVADCSVLSSQNVTMDVYAGTKKIADSLTFQGTSTFTFTYVLAETISLSLDNATPNASNALECSYSNCEITFTDAEFTFSTITNQVAGVEFADIVLTATKSKRAGAGFSCISDDTFVSKTVTIDLAQENIAPSGTGGLSFTLNSDATSLAKYPSFTAVDLVFDADAKAVIPKPNYKDAGQIRLQASYDSGGTDISGASNSFWVRPDALTLSAASGGTELNATTVSASPTHKAGADFDLNVTAVNADGDTTQNYAPGQIQLKLERTGPTSGSNEGNFTYAAGNSLPTSLSPAFTDVTLTAFSFGGSGYSGAKYSDVGLLNLDVQDTSYGDGSMTISASAIDIGRFVPDHFTLFSSQVSGWCGAGDPNNFVYMDQPELEISYQLQAQNQGGEVTKNYFDHADSAQDYAKAGVGLVAENNNDGADLALRLSGFSGNWVEGVYALGNVKGSFNRNASALDGPFENLLFGINVDDGETPAPLSLLTGQDMRADTNDACTTNTDPATDCNAKQLTGTANIRFGRWFVENNFGPETANLPLVMSVQYWDGANFITNPDDSCTSYNGETANNYAFDNTSLNPALAANPGIVATTGTGIFLNGSNSNAPLMLMAPGADNVGNIHYIYGGSNDVTPAWLKYDWDGDNSHDDNPKGLASFGYFRGNDRIISWREAF
ncbi:hypothetical protein SG34_017280 [Thalassomonas viridans]|uniref:MSHA biogenesis protein MshQ n=1 Tax=Thalassomonas viridans TaxID=137584 RepID=A0AAE9YXQ2_9GAMM|nr:DUF6701 domain-containing protein [Thalassomonas viridans]WDE03161.1 hypothetical protein SG34_017280 [Thalassomonas viridans]